MTGDKKNPMSVLRMLEVLSSELGNEAPLTHARLLLYVAQGGDAGVDQGALARMLDVDPGTVARAAQALGKLHHLKDSAGNRRPGLDLINSEQNPQNFRLRTLTLTTKGKALIKEIGGVR